MLLVDDCLHKNKEKRHERNLKPNVQPGMFKHTQEDETSGSL